MCIKTWAVASWIQMTIIGVFQVLLSHLNISHCCIHKLDLCYQVFSCLSLYVLPILPNFSMPQLMAKNPTFSRITILHPHDTETILCIFTINFPPWRKASNPFQGYSCNGSFGMAKGPNDPCQVIHDGNP